ncbi:MAG: transglycosylase domain-containing protein, partial [Longimicrobiales bacterium]
MQNAFIAIEDRRFWDHEGVDWLRVAGAFWKNIKALGIEEGSSTITMQLARNVFPDKLPANEKTVWRKLGEARVAKDIEAVYSKQEILELYLNQIYFGQGRYGIVEAARYYFGKELKELDAGEIAYLAGLPQAPETISKNNERGADRRAYVLNQMLRYDLISEAEVKRFIDADVPQGDKTPPPIAPEVVDLVRAELRAEHGDAALDTLGAEVRVSIQPDLQKAARAALQARLRKYDAKHKVGIPIRKVAADKVDAELAKLKKKLPSGGPQAGEVYL